MKLVLVMLIILATAFCQAESADEIIKKAQNFYSRGNYEKALSLYTLALRTGGDKPETYAALARCYSRLYEKSPEYAFHNWDLYMGKMEPQVISETLIQIDDYWGKCETERVIEIFNRYLSKVRDSDQPYEGFLYRLASLHLRLEQKDQARKYLEEIIDYYGRGDYRQRSLDSLYKLALSDKDFEGALEYLEKMPETFENLKKKVDLYMASGQVLDAVRAQKSVINEAEDDSEEYSKELSSLLSMQLRLRQHDKALDTINMLLPVTKGLEQARLKLEKARIWHYDRHSFLLKDDGSYINSYENTNKAEDIYTELLEYDEYENIARSAHLELSRLYLSIFHYNKAEEHLREILSEYRDSAEAVEARELIKKIK